MNWYITVLKNYTGFSGRARRQEYWMFVLFNAIILAALYLPGLLTQETAFLVPYFLYALAVFVPSLAVTVRRLHDTGRSGWMYLISLIPLIGGIMLLLWTTENSKPDANQYGPNPKFS